MSAADVTVVVTVHDESVVCGPTMASAQRAAERARAAGHSVQQVVALDRPTPATTRYFEQPDLADWERWRFEEGDPGKVRNAAIPRAQGRFVALLDADDLFSANWLARGVTMLKAAEDAGERIIVHPELNVIFDGGAQLNHNIGQDSPFFTPHFLYVRNCYDTLCLAPREAHLEVPYALRDIAHGLSREDWQFAIETMERGWRHVVAEDTIIFKRRRDSSMMVESAGRGALLRALPAMAIDRVRDLARPGRRGA